MKPVFTQYTNKIFEPSSSQNQSSFLAVPLTEYKVKITEYKVKNKNVSEELVVSEICWELSEEELKKIKRTGKLYTMFLGKKIPTIQLETKPFHTIIENDTNDDMSINISNTTTTINSKDVIISEDYIQKPRQTAIDINISFKANTTLSDDIVDLIVNGQLGIRNLIEEYLYDHVEILGNHFEDYEINTHKDYIIKKDK